MLKKIIPLIFLTGAVVLIFIFLARQVATPENIHQSILKSQEEIGSSLDAGEEVEQEEEKFQDKESDNPVPSFEFSFEREKNIINECDDDKEVGITNALWSDEESFVVELCANINCGKSIRTLSYALRDDTLTLIYYVEYMRNEMNTCKHKLIYNFSNLVKKDYKIVLKEIDVDDRCGTPPPTK